MTDEYRPSFVISKRGQSLDATKIAVCDEILEKLTKKGLFSVPFEFDPEEQAEVVIYLCLSEEQQDWFMISGFPKRLNKSILSGKPYCLEPYKNLHIAYLHSPLQKPDSGKAHPSLYLANLRG